MAIHGGQLLLLLLPLVPIFFVLVIRKGKKQEAGPQTKLPPGPPQLPIIGNLHQLGKLPHRTLWKLSKQYGPLMYLQLGRVPAVVVSSSQVAEQVLKTHDLQFCSRPSLTLYKRVSYNFSDVVCSPYNATWRELKKISMLKLLNPKMVEGFRAVREGEVVQMMSSISRLASLSKPVNLAKLLHTFSRNIVCRAAFGRRSFRGEERERDFHKIFLESQELATVFFVGDYFPSAGWVDVLSRRTARLEKMFTELDSFYEEVIAAHEDPTRPAQDEEDFVDVLLRLQKEDAHLTTKDHVKGVLMNIFSAGTDTTAGTLEYAMAELMRNPSVMLTAQDEVRKIAGGKGKVEEGDVPQLSYLKSVVKETLRLHPVAPLLIPHETMGHVNVFGYDIVPGTRVIVNAWALGREPDNWDRPNVFDPDRFTDSAIDFKGQDFQFIPFGAGRRICPGLHFAIRTVELALANLLHCFNWEVPEGTREEGIDMDEAPGIAVHLKSSLNLKATKNAHG